MFDKTDMSKLFLKPLRSNYSWWTSVDWPL